MIGIFSKLLGVLALFSVVAIAISFSLGIGLLLDGSGEGVLVLFWCVVSIIIPIVFFAFRELLMLIVEAHSALIRIERNTRRDG